MLQNAKCIFLTLLALISGAYGQIDVYYNNSTSPITFPYPITYGDLNTFSVKDPSNEYDWCWTEATFCLSSDLTWKPDIDKNPDTPESRPMKIIRTRKDDLTEVSMTFTLNIQPRPSFAVTFNADGGTPVPSVQTVLKDSLAKEPATAPTKTGYTFEGWYDGAAKFNFSTGITAPKTLTAQWKALIYTMTWKCDNGEADKTTQVPHDGTPTPPACSTKQSTAQYSYAPNGWLPAIATATGPQTYTMQYTSTLRSYKVEWEVNGFITQTNNNVDYGTNNLVYSVTPNPPEKTSTPQYDYTFKEWLPSLSAQITGDTKYVAQFDSTLRSYDITWIVDGNPTIKSAPYGSTPGYGSTPLKPQNDYYTYTFSSWSPAIAPVTGIATYTAQFTQTDRLYPITLNPQGGTVSPATISTKFNVPLSLPTPSRPGYTFEGWFNASTGGTEYTGQLYDNSFKPSTLYAQWTIITYTIIYDPKGGTTTSPEVTSYTIANTEILLPTMQEQCGMSFDGWCDNPGLTGACVKAFTPNANNIGNKTFYAKWTASLATPSASLLSHNIASLNLTYNGSEISPVSVTANPANQCDIGTITEVRYNGSAALPKNAGTYTVSVVLAESNHYKAATIELTPPLVIAGQPVDIDLSYGYYAEDKFFDNTTTATIGGLVFDATNLPNGEFFPGDSPVENIDYTVSANFADKNVGDYIDVSGSVNWIASSAFNKNYIITPNPTPIQYITANIMQAKGIIKIEAPKNYTIAVKTEPKILEVSKFITNPNITWEYRFEEKPGVYTAWLKDTLPGRVGYWQVKASFPGDVINGNYTGAADSADFLVTRGDFPARRSDSKISFGEVSFTLDTTALGKTFLHKEYFVAGHEDNCSVSKGKGTAMTTVTLDEPDLILKIDGATQRSEDCGIDEPCYTRYFIDYPIKELKPGTDTIVYVLMAKYDDFEEIDTIIIERPIPFEKIIAQKWNNTLVVNNNSQNNSYSKNGGYNFDPKTFKWFKDGEEELSCKGLQFCSAGSKSTDTLSSESKYTVQMNYIKDGETYRISSCQGSPKIKTFETPAQSSVEKRVLGINGKTAPPGSKVYNSKGERVSGEAPGLYLIENK